MNRHYLIDGYNVMHALGLISVRTKAEPFEKARQHFLEMLVTARQKRPESAITVIFDAAAAVNKRQPEQTLGGVRIQFAIGYPQADDLIEQLIWQEPQPRSLCVVSDDNRLRRAAKRRGCGLLACVDYLEEAFLQRPTSVPATPKADNRDQPSVDDVQLWLQTFGHLEEDNDLSALFKPPVPETEE